ncbi:hypothetical protein [Cupriavidus sp. USMAHM13]|uniref:hypothetical protein n=1 Tax=Cupriavidus sp. USMAHM13 TaxID=1389192 RepID=UPI0012EAB192|nr:hypothetical protein [Cupriavidus sp. USMAHM13]
MDRRAFLVAGGLAPLVLGGCVTSSLYQEIERPEYESYRETISQILVSRDGKAIVILGDKYHYIFDADSDLLAAISSDLHPRLKARFGRFDVDTEGKIRGSLYLGLDDAVSDEARSQAAALGFKAGGQGDKPSLTRAYHLSGTRYSAAKFELPGEAKQLNQAYEVHVSAAKSIGAKKALVLLTPVTVAADGVLSLLSIPLIPVVIGLLGSRTWP